VRSPLLISSTDRSACPAGINEAGGQEPEPLPADVAAVASAAPHQEEGDQRQGGPQDQEPEG
jgi:hypothetical protein